MKKHTLYLLPVTLIISLGLNHSAMAADGTVTFSGTVVDATCTGDSPAVDLGSASASKFNNSTGTAAKDHTTRKPFKISLTNCPATGTKVGIRFDGEVAAGANTYTFDSGLAGVGIEISSEATEGGTTGTTWIAPGDLSNMTTTAVTLPMNYSAWMVATSATPTKGSVSKALDYTIIYQ
jgi:P pilus assembly protein, pilin FimA